MFTKRKTPNPKRKIAAAPSEVDLERWENAARYGGNPEHKRNPGNFSLTPPSSPRRDKSLCDEAGIFTREQALALLIEGIRRGLVSEQVRNGYPQNVWAVTDTGIALEGQLENSSTGAYHGYPMPSGDPFREKVRKHWNKDED